MIHESVICVSLSEWNDLPHNSRHLMRVAHRQGFNVLYVESVGLRAATLTTKDARKILRRLARLRKPLRKVDDRFWVFSPIALPRARSNTTRAVNAAMVAMQLRLAARLLGLKKPIFWTYLPAFASVGRWIGAHRTVYYRTDEYGLLGGMEPAQMEALERRAIASADLCIGAAERYLKDVFADAKRALWIPNAVDLEHYGRAAPLVSRPDSVIILMIGTLEAWVDEELIVEIARLRRKWAFVFAGTIKQDFSSLLKEPNVRHLGVVPYEELPRFVASCDVGIIPFRLEPITIGATPGKLYQYLAAGKPVVVTDFLGTNEFPDDVFVADANPSQFVAAIEAALASNTPDRAVLRREQVAVHSWEARFATITAALAASGYEQEQ